jgi:cytochrome c556
MKQLFLACGTAVTMLATIPAQAQFAKVEDAVDYRQSVFTIMANHMGRLSAMVRGQVAFDAAKAQDSARLIDQLAKMPWEAFPAGSNTNISKLKGDPWKDAAQFRQHQDKLMAETAKLVPAAASVDSLRAQMGAVGASCKACHDSFRQ